MYNAIRKFEIDGKKFDIGDEIPSELVTERLIRGRKIAENAENILLIDESAEVDVKTEISEAELTEAELTEEVKTEEVKTEEVKTEEVKTEEVKTEEVKTEEVKTEEVKTEVIEEVIVVKPSKKTKKAK